MVLQIMVVVLDGVDVIGLVVVMTVHYVVVVTGKVLNVKCMVHTPIPNVVNIFIMLVVVFVVVHIHGNNGDANK